MNEFLPPVSLVKTWLDVLQSRDVPETIKLNRLKLIKYYFNSTDIADLYVEVNQYNVLFWQ